MAGVPIAALGAAATAVAIAAELAEALSLFVALVAVACFCCYLLCVGCAFSKYLLDLESAWGLLAGVMS